MIGASLSCLECGCRDWSVFLMIGVNLGLILQRGLTVQMAKYAHILHLKGTQHPLITTSSNWDMFCFEE